MNRRKLLLALMAAGSAPLASAFAAPDARVPRPGIQLYTVRSEMEKDFRGTLAALAKMGYAEVEFAGYYGRKASEVKALLQELNLTAPSAHIGDALSGADAQRTIDDALTAGHHYLVCPWTPKEQWADLDGWKRRAQAFNKAGELCRKAGLQFAYHNHHFEFAKLANGQTAYDILLTECDPQLVQLELDLYWAAAARQDPLAILRAHPGRFPMVHLKQLSGLPKMNGSDVLSLDMADAHRTMADVGPGLIDFAALLNDPAAATIQHFFVEHDAPKNALESAANSLRFVQGLKKKSA